MIPLKLHPRICDICEGIAERPYTALWDAKINKRVSLCSRTCLDSYMICTKSTEDEIFKKRNVERRNSI